MEGISVRAAALKLQDLFMASRAGERPAQKTAAPDPESKRETKADPEPAAPVNHPLGFKLEVDPEHEYGKQRGFSPDIYRQFGAGFCRSKGMFSGRWIWPLSDGNKYFGSVSSSTARPK